MLLERYRGGSVRPAHPRPWLGDPWHPTGVAQVPANSSGSVNALAFRPPSQGAAVVLSAIKFQIMASVQGTGLGPQPVGTQFRFASGYQWGHAISVSFALAKYNSSVAGGQDPSSGDVPALGTFTGRVPIGTLCDSRNILSELLSGGFAVAGAFTGVAPISEYRWELPAPFFIPPGYILLPQLYGLSGNISGNVGAFGAALTPTPALRVQVSYEGTLLDPVKYGNDSAYDEDVTRVPFAAAWIAPAFAPAVNGAVYQQQSDETQLANIYDEPAYLTRICGRIIPQPEFNDTAVDAGPGWAVRMLAGNHLPIVRDYVAFREVFDRQTRAWCLPQDKPYSLAPGEAIIASITNSNTTANNIPPPGIAITANVQPVIVVSGYRELPLSAL